MSPKISQAGAMRTHEAESTEQADDDYGMQQNSNSGNIETLAYKILLQKSDNDIASIFQTYARNLKHEEIDQINASPTTI